MNLFYWFVDELSGMLVLCEFIDAENNRLRASLNYSATSRLLHSSTIVTIIGNIQGFRAPQCPSPGALGIIPCNAYTLSGQTLTKN